MNKIRVCAFLALVVFIGSVVAVKEGAHVVFGRNFGITTLQIGRAHV